MTPRQTIATVILIGLLGFELPVLAILAFFPYLPDPGLSSLNMNINTLFAPFSPALLLGLLYAWLVKLGIKKARQTFYRFNSFIWFLSEPFREIISSVKNTSLSDSAYDLKILSRPKLMLAIGIVVSVLLVFVPYRPDLNPTHRLVGIDSPLYVDWINQMLARPLPDAVQYSFVTGLEGSRPLLLTPLYLVASLGVASSEIIKYLPMLLAPLLTLSIYSFVSFGQGSTRLAGLTALFSSVSFYHTVGLWGGYYRHLRRLVDNSKELNRRVDFVTAAHDEELIGLLQNCSLFLSTRTYDYLGLAALEAMACGKPVIAYNSEEVSQSSPVTLCGTTPRLWEKALKNLMNDRRLREKIGKESRKFVEKHHTWQDAANLMLSHIKRVA